MKGLLQVVFCIAVLGLSHPAMAAKWLNLGVATAAEDRFIDTESITKKGDYVVYRSKTVYANRPIQQAEYTWLMNCAEATASLQGVKQFDKEGRVLVDDAYPDVRFTPIPPDSMGDLYYRVVCQWDTETTHFDTNNW